MIKRGAAIGVKIITSLVAGTILIVNDVVEDVVEDVKMTVENIMSKELTDEMEKMIDRSIEYNEPFKNGEITIKEYFELVKEA